jgi:class I fructose-bisphosphate aldolase
MTSDRLNHLYQSGRLKNTGKLLIYPVDQGLERGPLQCFGSFPETFDPFYHVNLALSIGASAYACPVGAMEVIAQDFHDKIPLILKLNSSHRLYSGEPDQALIGSVDDALDLKCAGIGFTIYPGSHHSLNLIKQAREMIVKARAHGLLSVIWSYARGASLSPQDETAFDVICYSAHIAAQIGADVIKVKIPSNHLFDKTLTGFEKLSLPSRIKHVMKSAMGKPVVFSGGEAKNTNIVLEEIRGIKEGGGSGSIIGRNLFQRPHQDALKLADEIISIYLT